MRDNFVFRKSFYEGIKELSAEEKTQVVMAIMDYQFNNKEPELNGISKGMFELIKQQLDQDNLNYENGKKGGRPRMQKPPFLENENPPFEKEEKEKNQKKKKKEYIYPPISPQGELASEATKIHFAEFVTMTNAEYEKLCSTHGKEFADQCIEVLDNYKGASGKKYKSDYRAILNWVVDRVKQRGMPFTREKNSEADEKARLLEQAAKEWGMTQ
jgi:hypothetical protein